MWGAQTKNKAVDAWHTKAMLVDPKKTKITIIWNTESEIYETAEHSETRALSVETYDPIITMASNAYNAKGLAAVKQNFENVEQNLEIMESNMNGTPDFDVTIENLETIKLNPETAEPEAIQAQNKALSERSVENTSVNLTDLESYCETADFDDSEILSADETLDDLENAQPSLQSMPAVVVEAQDHLQSEEDIRIIEQNPETRELESPEASNTIALSDNLDVEQPNEIEVEITCKAEDSNFELVHAERVPENAMFLRALEKTRSKWGNDKKFAKIVQKMEKGKKLRGKEFEQVYTHIRNYCQHN